MTDPARLEAELLAQFPEPWVRLHLTSFPEAYFAALARKTHQRVDHDVNLAWDWTAE